MSSCTMGISTEVLLTHIGVLLPRAYIAVANHQVVTQSNGDGTFAVRITYSIWNSHEDRLAGRRSIHDDAFIFTTSSVDTYAVAYDELKKLYPDSEDVQVADPEPEP